MNNQIYNKSRKIDKILMALMLTMCMLVGSMYLPGLGTKVYADTIVAPKIACGDSHSILLKPDGTVWAWGYNGYRQLGNGSTSNSNQPVQVKGANGSGYLTGVVDIACGAHHSVALKSDGTVWTWGKGQTSYYPVQVKDVYNDYLSGIIAIDAGTDYTAVLKNDGTVWVWGDNTNGQFGEGYSGGTSASAYEVSGGESGTYYLTGITAISCGSSHVLAVKSDGTVYTWGLNSSGQLGNGKTTTSYLPVKSSITGVKAVSGGSNHSMALKTDGTIWAWGDNSNGQLGNHTLANPVPQQISECYNLNRRIQCSNNFNYILTDSYSAQAWGKNDKGQLGIGNNTNTSAPTVIQLPAYKNVYAVAAGSNHGTAIMYDGTVWTWGYNNYGQLGNGNTNTSNRPVNIMALSMPDLPSAPYNVTAAIGDKKVSLTWTASSGASYYSVYRSSMPGDRTSPPIKTNLTTNSYEDTNVVNGTTYYYTITASNIVGEAVGNFVQATPNVPPPPIPQNLTVTNSEVKISLKWDASAGATSYRIFRSTSQGGPWSLQNPYKTGITTNSYDDTNVTIGTCYYYMVTALNGSSQSWFSNDVSAVPKIARPANPTGLSGYADNWKIHLSWTASTGATSYNVKRATTSNGSYTTLAYISTNYFDDYTALNGNRYYYIVTAINSSGESGSSNEASVPALYQKPPAPVYFTATEGDSNVTLKWRNSVTGSNCYNNIQRKTAGGSYTTIKTNITSLSYTDTGLTNGTTYYYRVTEVTAGIESDPSAEVSAVPNIPKPSTPTGLTASAGDSKVTLNWNSASGAQSYNVKRADAPGGDYSTIATASALTYVDTDVVNGNTYYYIVTASNIVGESGASAQASAAPFDPRPSAPTGLTATADNARVVLNWNPVSNTQSFNIKRAVTPEAEYSIIATISASTTTYTDADVVNGNTYYYSVTASNTAGESGSSGVVFATPIPPVPSAPVGLKAEAGNTKVTLNWTQTPNAETYSIKRSELLEGPYDCIATVSALNYTDTDVTAWNTYYYMVSAINRSGESTSSTIVSSTPYIPVVTPSYKIVGGNAFGTALRRDGTVWVWGINEIHTLGDGTYQDKNTPELNQYLSDIRSINSGDNHSLAVKNDGTVLAWGCNASSELGDGTRDDRSTPVQVTNLDHVKAAAPGGYNSVAVKEDGTVWTWGWNSDGMLGSTDVFRSTPGQVEGLTDVVDVGAGGSFMIALKNDGTVWAWGDTYLERSGDIIYYTSTSTPTQIASGARSIAAGPSGALIIKNDGTVWQWLMFNNIARYTPTQVVGINNAVSASVGCGFAMVLTEDGKVWTWGENDRGQLGDGTYNSRNIPQQISGLDRVVSIGCGYFNVFAVKSDGSVWAWGNNTHGELGDGTNVSRNTPAPINWNIDP